MISTKTDTDRMRTYKVTFRLKGSTALKVKYVPSFSEEEAKTEVEWLAKSVYDKEAVIIETTEEGRLRVDAEEQ